MARQKKSKIVSIITWLLLLLLLVGGIGAIIHFSGIDKGDITDIINPVFRVEYDGVTYTGADNEIALPNSGQAKFTVKGVSSYTLKVSPNVTPQTDIDYTVDGKTYPYSGEDLTDIIVKKTNVFNDNFVIDCTESFLLQDVLSRIWGGKEITLNGVVSYPYLITVTGNNGETITFKVNQKSVIGVTLPEIIQI